MSTAEFDFDAWAQLAKSDPEAFEAQRQKLIDDFIANAPEAVRNRLTGAQWRIDMERRRSDNPLQACMRISSMMWDMIYADRGFLWSLQVLSDPRGVLALPEAEASRAEVVALPLRDRLPQPK